MGRTPTSLDRLGDTQANLMLNARFPCTGYLSSVTYYRGSPTGVAFIGVWQQVGDSEYILRHKVALPAAPIGIHTVYPPSRLPVERGEFLGIHYPRDADSGVIVSSIPEDQALPPTEFYQTLTVNVKDENITQDSVISFHGLPSAILRKTFAFQGVLEYDMPGATVAPTPGTTAYTLYL